MIKQSILLKIKSEILSNLSNEKQGLVFGEINNTTGTDRVKNLYAPVNWRPPPHSLLRARVGDNGGMDALLNKIAAQGGVEPPHRHAVDAMTFSWKLEQIQCKYHTVTIWTFG